MMSKTRAIKCYYFVYFYLIKYVPVPIFNLTTHFFNLLQTYLKQISLLHFHQYDYINPFY
jgi:hypothetical protein